jgi:hypothetical protein
VEVTDAVEATMGFLSRRRTVRAGLVTIAFITLLSGAHAAALASVPIDSTGEHGEYSVTDTTDQPGATCRYEGTAGSWYLGRIHVPAPTVYGSTAEQRSVGYRLLLQRRTAQGWQTVQRGTLISGVADENTAATLTGSTIARDIEKAPNSGRYRAALNLIWWDANAQVDGRVVLAMEHHRRTSDQSVGPSCKARVPTAD